MMHYFFNILYHRIEKVPSRSNQRMKIFQQNLREMNQIQIRQLTSFKTIPFHMLTTQPAYNSLHSQLPIFIIHSPPFIPIYT